MPLHFELTTPVDDDRPVYISGNFCDWDATLFEMQRTGPNTFFCEFPEQVPLPELIEYKYNRGGWEHVELDFTGEGIPNRTIHLSESYRTDYVAHWQWNGLPFDPEKVPNVELLSEDFEIPQLETTRRIHVLLPHDYHSTGKPYPVLYLHDGQNLFGEGAEYGSWNVDQKMAILAARRRHEVIIVSIDHGEGERISEFSLHRTRFGRGKGRQYLNFIAKTLKPQIDARYRTLSDATHTGIGGSSMGGLISIYAGLMFPEMFGRLMIFSPSLWIAPKIYFDAIQFRRSTQTKVYIYGGGAESTYMISNLQRLQSACLHGGCADLTVELTIDPDGQHNEARWGREFPKAIEWLFYEQQ
ncbi:alpha/beta hydrolase [Tellurirhabdus bombi]|uniref:alpha/beta hydrolase n=1 Tax=Tellurirhabdus bombi TaxID=2907205 RepID=UPI001EEA7707|nr:alpha/beta hydrolase-fold protein [Tellurirhabdus bombi]